jgi:hypothetical protein
LHSRLLLLLLLRRRRRMGQQVLQGCDGQAGVDKCSGTTPLARHSHQLPLHQLLPQAAGGWLQQVSQDSKTS